MKKRTSLARLFLLSLLLVGLLVPTAYADIGPKPQLTITVVNAPEGTLYVDLLANRGRAGSEPYIGVDGSTAVYGRLPYDPVILENLRSLEGNGWVLAYSTGLSVPVSGDIRSNDSQNGNPVYRFGYTGLPGEFKLVAATADEAKLSELFIRDRFYTNAVYDWEANTLTYVTPTPLFWGAQLASTLIPTLIVEGLILYLFGYRAKRSWAVFLIVNVVTQIGLHLALSGSAPMYAMSEHWLFYTLLLFFEVVVWVIEAIAYAILLREQEYSQWRAVGYAFAANIASYLAGYIPLLLVSPFLRSL